jgi:hypothetical protein
MGTTAVSLSELTDYSTGAFASWWRATSVSDSFTNIAICKRVEEIVEGIEDKVQHVRVYGQISCAAAATNGIIADAGQDDGTVLGPFLATTAVADVT